jgi:hypothetical protein
VPETVIIGVLRTKRGHGAVAAAAAGPPPKPSEPSKVAVPTVSATGSATTDPPKLVQSTGGLSPVDSPLGAATPAAPGATELLIANKARPTVPATESQVPPTRLEPDNVAARGRLETGR